MRPVLIAGFGGMLLIFTIAALQALSLLTAMRTENQVLRKQALDRSHRLATVRYCVLLSQSYLNQRFGNPAADSEASIRDQWNRMLAQLNGDADFDPLRTLLEEHWQGLSRAMQTQGELDSEPLRISALQITERVQDIDAKETAAAQLQIQDQFERLGHDLNLALNLALATALLLAMGCGIYIAKIEKQNRRRYEEIGQLSARIVNAQETERRTISRELHDQVGQTLNAVLVDAANLAKRIPADDDVSQRYLNNIRSYADSSVNSIRDISLLLRPSMLDDLGLIPALEWQARETSRRTGIDVKVSAEDADQELPDAVRTAVYRLVQEALQNVARHSKATHARINVARSGGMLNLTVEDDGAGFDPARTRGLGLLGMEERVRQLGGRLEVRSSAGHGATVRAALPVGSTK